MGAVAFIYMYIEINKRLGWIYMSLAIKATNRIYGSNLINQKQTHLEYV